MNFPRLLDCKIFDNMIPKEDLRWYLLKRI